MESKFDEPAKMSFLRDDQVAVLAAPHFPLQPPLLLHQHLDHLLKQQPSCLIKTALVTRTPTGKSVREFSFAQLQDLSQFVAERFLNKLRLHQHHLHHPKDQNDVPYIAFCARKSPELFIAVLGALKAGCAYLPIDYDWPAERFRYVLHDARPSLVVVDAEVFKHQIVLDEYCNEHNKVHQIEIEKELFHRLGGDDEKHTHKLPDDVEPDRTALILYTSGSTGEPKGVKIPHRGLMNAVQFRLRRFPYFPDEDGLSKTVLTFSDHALEMFETWFNLRPLIVLTKEDLLDARKFVQLLEHNRIYRMILVPSLLNAILDALESENQRKFAGPMWMISVGGEPVAPQLVERFFRHFPHTKLGNFYGATECSSDLAYEWWDDLASFESTRSAEGLVSIGRVIDNLNAYILNQNLQPAAVGEPGELYVSGPSVCESYIGTKMGKFLPNTLLAPANDAAGHKSDTNLPRDGHQTLLKTGDICLYDPRQQRLYLQGRSDDMVKIAGQKVHVVEVEKAVQQIPGLLESAVVSVVRLGQVKLVGFVRFATEEKADEHSQVSIRRAQEVLGRLLPKYAQPQLVAYQHAPLPRTESGKLAKRRLLEYYEATCENVSENDTTTPLGVLATSIGVPQNAIDSQRTFVENGGSSLKLLPAVLALKNAGFNIELNDFLRAISFQEIITLCEQNRCGNFTNGQQKPDEVPQCSFEVVQKQLRDLDRKEVIDLVADSFGNHQDLAMFGEISEKEMVPVLELFYPIWLKDDTSFGLVERGGDERVVAVSLSIDNATQIPETSPDRIGPTFNRYIHELLGSLDKMLEPHVPKGKGKVMHAMMDAILPAVSASDKVALMYQLFVSEIKIARSRKFECIMAETASPLTAQLAHDFITHKIYVKVKPKDFVASDGRMPWIDYPDDHFVYGDVLWLNERNEK